jgi:hypothetical protein
MQRKPNIYYSFSILNKLVPIHIALIKFNHSFGPVIEGIITFACAKRKNYKQRCHVSLKSEPKICHNLLLAHLTHLPSTSWRRESDFLYINSAHGPFEWYF